jgi:hypothetical protein
MNIDLINKNMFLFLHKNNKFYFFHKDELNVQIFFKLL